MRYWIGWDPREDLGYRIARHSAIRHSTTPISVYPVRQRLLAAMGLFWRTSRLEHGKNVDTRDGKPFSTAFSFSRFLVPHLAGRRGWALFTDCDVLWTVSPHELFELRDERYAVMVVKHDHRPENDRKFLNEVQTRYERKNWSSVVLWNCAHPANGALTIDAVNEQPGSWLHGFRWLDNHLIGELPPTWNHLVGWSKASALPALIHYTEGTPDMPGYADCEYANLWLAEQRAYEFAKARGEAA